MTTSSTTTGFALAALALLAPPALARAFPPAPPTELATVQEPRLPPPPSARRGDDAQREMREIVARVERALRTIDVYLSDAAAGEVPLEVPQDSGLDDLLRTTQEQSQGVVRDMDRLLEIAVSQSRQTAQSGGSGNGKPKPNEGESPLDQDRGDRPQEPEPTPERPSGKPEGPEEKPAGGDPAADDASDEASENHPNEPPPGNRDGLPQRGGDEGERWGELPPHAREVFRSQGGGDLPTQYRDWIDSYYRRLNRRP